jgi:hypothetical protein
VTAEVAPATTRARELAEDFVGFLERGTPSRRLFAPHVFCDFTMPTWRIQAEGVEAAVALRLHGHPGPSRVVRRRFDPTPTGFVLEVEETWDSGGEHWYSRELFRADITEDGIAQLSVYCTGDWDTARVAQHAASVRLIRP